MVNDGAWESKVRLGGGRFGQVLLNSSAALLHAGMVCGATEDGLRCQVERRVLVAASPRSGVQVVDTRWSLACLPFPLAPTCAAGMREHLLSNET